MEALKQAGGGARPAKTRAKADAGAGFILDATLSAGGGGVETGVGVAGGHSLLVGIGISTVAVTGRGRRPILARWQSTATIVAAMIISTGRCIRGDGPSPG